MTRINKCLFWSAFSTWSGNIRQERIAWAAQNSASENLELSKVLDLKWD